MTLALDAHPANRPALSHRIFFLLASEILAQLILTVIVFALALSSSPWGAAFGMCFAAVLLGHSVADAATRFLRVAGVRQQVMIARIVTFAALVVVSVTPAFLAAVGDARESGQSDA